VVLDASFFQLTAKFIDVNGEVLDQFTINRLVAVETTGWAARGPSACL
jgi:hypothetical protein